MEGKVIHNGYKILLREKESGSLLQCRVISFSQVHCGNTRSCTQRPESAIYSGLCTEVSLASNPSQAHTLSRPGWALSATSKYPSRTCSGTPH